MIWWHASFGEALTIHLFTGHDIATPRRALGPHVSGYVLEDGKVYGIVSSEGDAGIPPCDADGRKLSVTDVRGKTFDVTYSTVNGCYWAPCPSNTYLQASLRRMQRHDRPRRPADLA